MINGMLYADKDDNVIQITRTMPLNEVFDTNTAFLPDAEGSIISNGITYPLEYIGYSGLYRPVGLRPKLGDTYTLNVRWRHMIAEAATRVPTSGKIDTIFFTEEFNPFGFKRYLVTARGIFDHDVSARPEIEIFTHYTDRPNTSSRHYTYPTLQNARKDGSPTLFKSDFYFWNEDQMIFDSVKTTFYTYASGYYEYYHSRRSEGDEIPGGSPTPVKWNVTGQAIGIFFGAAVDSTTFKL